MKCDKCGSKMRKVNLRFSACVSPYKFAFYCPKCGTESSTYQSKEKNETTSTKTELS